MSDQPIGPNFLEVDRFFSYYDEDFSDNEDDFRLLFGEEFCDRFTEDQIDDGTMDVVIDFHYNRLTPPK